jgi:transposase
LPNDTTRLFGLGGVEVVGVEVADDDIPILVVVTCDEQARCCPGCGARSQRPHSWARARPRDLPVAGRRTGLIWIKRRWRCLNPQCERTTFTESLPAIPPRSRLTVRLRTSVGEAVADGGRTVVQSARDHEVSWPVANAAFTTAAEAALPKDTPPVTHLGIDETRRGKAKFHLVETSDGGEAWARMHADHLDPMVADLKALPKPIGEPILAAWNCKEDLMDLLALHGTNPDRTTISRLLTAFYESAAASGLPEMERLATTVSTWWPQILAAITTGVTNAASERINRAIKTDARCAYGYRNPVNQRRRARCATTRRSRGHLTTHTSGRHAQPRSRP